MKKASLNEYRKCFYNKTFGFYGKSFAIFTFSLPKKKKILCRLRKFSIANYWVDCTMLLVDLDQTCSHTYRNNSPKKLFPYNNFPIWCYYQLVRYIAIRKFKKNGVNLLFSIKNILQPFVKFWIEQKKFIILSLLYAWILW